MDFVHSLPVGLANRRWQINAPAGGFEAKLSRLYDGTGLAIDLEVYRDDYQASLRVMPDRKGVVKDPLKNRVYELQNAVVFFIDEFGSMSDEVYVGRIVITLEVTEPGVSAGHVTLWQEEKPLFNQMMSAS